MSEMIAGVEFSDEALNDLRTAIRDEARWRGFTFSIAAMLTHHDELKRMRLRTLPPDWPRVRLEKWPAHSIWLTEIGGYKIAYLEGKPVHVLYIWEP
jgi:hypothetical protein